jgi:hypothetical protein
MLGFWLRKRRVRAAVRPQLASGHIVHDNREDARPQRVHASKANHCGMTGELLQDAALKHDVGDLRPTRQPPCVSRQSDGTEHVLHDDAGTRRPRNRRSVPSSAGSCCCGARAAALANARAAGKHRGRARIGSRASRPAAHAPSPAHGASRAVLWPRAHACCACAPRKPARRGVHVRC